MALDLKPELEVSLRDPDNEVWTTDELDDILDIALHQVNIARPRVVRDTIALVAAQSEYTLTNVWSAVRVDLLDADDKLIRVLAQGTWEVWGDNASSGQTLYINPNFAVDGYSIRVHGYGPSDFTTNTPDETMQNAILALARVEALRRISTERSRFEQFATSNPRSDTSVNELIQLINEADSEANRLLRQIKLIRRPTVGRM